jgi:hypothetical protein
VALYKLYQWLKELDKYVEEAKEYLDELNKIYNIKLLRDASEHEIEYYKNKGNKQNKFINSDFNQSINLPLIIDGVY